MRKGQKDNVKEQFFNAAFLQWCKTSLSLCCVTWRSCLYSVMIQIFLEFLVFYLCYSAAFGRVCCISELCKVSVAQVSEGVCQEFRWRCSLCWFILTPILVPRSFPSGLFLTQPRLSLDALNLLLFASPGFVIRAVLQYICSGSKQLRLRCECKQFSSLSYVYILNDCTTMVARCCEIYFIKLWLLLFKSPSLWREQVLVRLQTVSSDCLSFIFPSFCSSSVEFREPRVIELWEAAKRANLSEDELDSLKVTLKSLVTAVWTPLLSAVCRYSFLSYQSAATLLQLNLNF